MTQRSAYPAQAHVKKVLGELFGSSSRGGSPSSSVLLYLEGEITRERHDTDRELPFKQEANFFYLTGFDAPGARLIVEASSATSYKSTLYLADVDEDLVQWSGFPPLVEEVKKTHDVDQVSLISRIEDDLHRLTSGHSSSTIYTLPWTTCPVSQVKHSPTELIAALHTARMVKDEHEIALIRQACLISSRAHETLMKNISRGEHLSTEAETEALFVQQCRRVGAKHQAYMPICAYGPHASTLHYIDNQSPFKDMPNGSLLLVDAGCEVDNYCADITRTMPIGNRGRFTKEGREIYDLVVQMQNAAFAELRPGADWEEIQLLMHKIATRGLLKLGLIKAGSLKKQGEDLVEELYEKCVSCAFFPHGLGHMLGLDTHDVGGLPHGRAKDPRLCYLRLRRKLQAGFVVTVEPGIYLNPFLVGKGCCGQSEKPPPWKQYEEWIDYSVVERYRYVGGVRIEDDVVITQDGYENLTKAVKTVDEIEALCSGTV